MKSRVKVELEVITREERVDIDAESTSTTTTPMSTGESPESMVGMMASKFPAARIASVEGKISLPKPPRK